MFSPEYSIINKTLIIYRRYFFWDAFKYFAKNKGVAINIIEKAVQVIHSSERNSIT
jgi:hypothetical protein|tara:strand:+ start:84 stop:251 length:168 start_codon:yes stop_codon:yes gene_type:complete